MLQYPIAGDNETQVARPHMALRGHSADGVCALAKTIARRDFYILIMSFTLFGDSRSPAQGKWPQGRNNAL